MLPPGTTRSRVTVSHAMIAPDSHVTAPLAGWQGALGVVLVSPRMGAGFSQYLVHLEAGSQSEGAALGVQRFVYVLEGNLKVSPDGQPETTLFTGDYAWLPPNRPHRLSSASSGRVLVFEKPYEWLSGSSTPEPVVGRSSEKPGEPFMGDPDARLQTLLPTEPGFDMAINIFTYQPGGTLPFVEVHIMEHGMMMLSGGGVYRLDESWYPVQAGDVIWMAPYCAQWFVAAGKQPASYIYYKDVNRDPLAEEAL